MKIELTDLKHNQSKTKFTYCYSGNLMVNDKHVAVVSNDGSGQETQIVWLYRSDQKKIERWCSLQPPIYSDYKDPNDNNRSIVFEFDFCCYVDEIFQKTLLKHVFDNLLHKRFLYIRNTELEVKATQEMNRESYDFHHSLGEEALKNTWGASRILNFMPYKEALGLFEASRGVL